MTCQYCKAETINSHTCKECNETFPWQKCRCENNGDACESCALWMECRKNGWKIVTSFDYPPIPIRNLDWSAIESNTYDAELVDGEWKGGPQGHGATELEAIQDLVAQLEERL